MARDKMDPKEAAGYFGEDKTVEPEKDKVESYGVGLKKSEWERYKEIGKEMQMTKHGVALFALRYFLKQYDAGKIKTGTKPTFKL
jgi:hypothetical protein